MTKTCPPCNGDCTIGEECPAHYNWRDTPGPVRTSSGLVIGSRWPGRAPVRDPGADAQAIQSALLRRGPTDWPGWHTIDRLCWWTFVACVVGAIGACLFGGAR